MIYANRREAGIALARALSKYEDRPDAVVVAIPRGGVVIGDVVAEELGLPLDVLLTKKIGHPDNPEYAIGVISALGAIFDEHVVERERIPDAYLRSEVGRLRALLEAREALYRRGRAPLSLAGKTAILVDDGVATGYTLEAAVELARREKAARVVVAAPVAPPGAAARFGRLADEAVFPLVPDSFAAIGEFYDDFSPVLDEEAVSLLAKRHGRVAGSRPDVPAPQPVSGSGGHPGQARVRGRPPRIAP